MAERSRASCRRILIVLVTALGVVLVPAGAATAITFGVSFEYAYRALIVESDVPNLPVGTLVPGNAIDVRVAVPGMTSLLFVSDGDWVLAGLLALPLQGARIFDTPGLGWSLDHNVDCPFCAFLFGAVPGPNTDITAFTEIILLPGDGSGFPPDAVISGMQTIRFVTAGVTIGTLVAIVPEPSVIALVATAGVACLALRRRARVT